MTNKENEITAPMAETVGSTFQNFLEDAGIAEEVNAIASQRLGEWREPQINAAQIEDTPLTEEDEAFFNRMPQEFFDELQRRAELAKSSPGIPVDEFRRRRLERRAAALHTKPTPSAEG